MSGMWVRDTLRERCCGQTCVVDGCLVACIRKSQSSVWSTPETLGSDNAREQNNGKNSNQHSHVTTPKPPLTAPPS